MKIFITGGTGFIGSHLINELHKYGYDLLCSKRANSIPRIELKREPKWIDNETIYLKDDFLKKIDVVINIASTGVSPQKATWKEMQKVNINFAIELMKKSIKNGVRRFISIGSGLEYGLEANRWDFIPPSASLYPISLYATSKAAAFFLLNQIATESSIEFFYGRIFTSYGDGQYSGNLLPNLRKAALKGNDFVLNSPYHIRDFIHVNEVVKHIRLAVKREDIIPKSPKIVNIGSGIGKSIYKFAFEEWNSLNAKGELKFNDNKLKNNGIQKMVADLKGLCY